MLRRSPVSLRARLARFSRAWWARRPEALTEILAVGALYLAYEFVRSLAPTHAASAYRNALTIDAFERAVHLNVELSLNRMLTPHSTLADLSSIYYQLAHETVALAVLVVFWRRRRDLYAALRNTLVLITVVAVIIYWMVPVAPPRLAMPGVVDTVSVRPGVLAGNSPVAGLVDLYAAMPSLHVAWAMWCALAVVAAGRSTWRHLAWLYPATTTLVVLATANHYVLDAVAGAALALAAARIAWQVTPAALPTPRAAIGPSRPRPGPRRARPAGRPEQVPGATAVVVRLPAAGSEATISAP